MDEERNERRLVDVSPGEVIAAGDIVKFIPEIAVAIVEVEMKEELGQRYGPDDRHAGSERRRFLSSNRHGKRTAGRCHGYRKDTHPRACRFPQSSRLLVT